MKKYQNIIEILDVVCDVYECFVCGAELNTDHQLISYRPLRSGIRLIIPVCTECLPNNSKDLKELVVEYIGVDARGYGLIN